MDHVSALLTTKAPGPSPVFIQPCKQSGSSLITPEKSSDQHPRCHTACEFVAKAAQGNLTD